MPVVKYLIEKGADVHARNDDALVYSVEIGHFDVMKYLIKNNADIHALDDLALRYSAAYGYLDIVSPNPGLTTRVRAQPYG